MTASELIQWLSAADPIAEVFIGANLAGIGKVELVDIGGVAEYVVLHGDGDL